MTVKRGGLAKSKKVRAAKASTASLPADAPEFAKSKWTPEQYAAVIASGETPEHLSDVHAMYERRNATSTEYGDTEFELGSSEAETSEVGAVAQDEVGTTEVPGSERNKGKKGDIASKGKRQGSGKRGEKGGLYGRLAKATGTTRGEARGVMKRARRQIRAGNTKAGARRISAALAGGPKAGVKRTPARKAQAAAAGTKIAKRIAARQSPGGGGGGSKPRRKKK